MQPRILFFTDLTLWSMKKGHGGPAFTQTLKKYLDEKWEVFLISDEPSNADYPYLDSSHNICVRPPVSRSLSGKRYIGVIFRWLHHRQMTRMFLREGCRLLKDSLPQTVIYAYDAPAVLAGKKLSDESGFPIVSRFQGTLVTFQENMKLGRLRLYPRPQALEIPTDLIIMTNDGTSGEETIRRHGNQSNLLFLRNGVELMGVDIPAMKAAFDREQFRAALGVGKEDIMFLTVSRVVDWKRLDRSIDGFAGAKKRGVIGKLVIVGDGNARSAMEQRTKDLGIADDVIFTGSVPHDDVYSYMMAADVFLTLYDMSNSGNPTFEALALGTCVISLDNGDVLSYIENRKSGILLPYRSFSTELLADAMAELAADPALRARLSSNAEVSAKAHFWDWPERMDVEFQAVSSLLKRSSDGTHS